MMAAAVQFPFLETDPALGAASRLPYMPLTLELGVLSIPVSALVDTGAALNVLPYDAGIQLGADWSQQQIEVSLTGNLARSPARALVVIGRIAHFPAVKLAFAWTRSNNVPVILGQINFFLEFDACFFRSQSVFEVRPK